MVPVDADGIHEGSGAGHAAQERNVSLDGGRGRGSDLRAGKGFGESEVLPPRFIDRIGIAAELFKQFRDEPVVVHTRDRKTGHGLNLHARWSVTQTLDWP